MSYPSSAISAINVVNDVDNVEASHVNNLYTEVRAITQTLIDTTIATATSASVLINALVPTQTGNNNKVLGTSGTAISWFASIQSLMTTQGDILYASSANTPARLGKGAARHVLAMNSSTTAPEWVASLHSIFTQTGDLVCSAAPNTPVRLGIGTAGQKLAVNSGATAPAWTDETIDNNLVIDGNFQIAQANPNTGDNKSLTLTNSLTNSGFESGSTGWTLNGSISVVSTAAKYGTYSAYQAVTASPGAYVSQTVTTVVGRKYYVCGWVKNSSNVSVVFDGGGTSISFANNAAFTFGGYVFTASSTSTTFNFGYNSSTSNGAGVWIDGLMVIDLSIVYGLGNEPTASDMSTLVNANSGWWTSTQAVTTTVEAVNPSSNGYPVFDMIFEQYNVDGGSLPNIYHSQQLITSGSVPGAKYCARFRFDGAGSSFGTNAYYQIRTPMENATQNYCGLNKKVTLSFYARTTISGTKRLGVNLRQRYGTGGSPSSAETLSPTENDLTLTSNWTKYTRTFTTNTLVGKTFGTNNDDRMDISFLLMAGTTEASTHGLTTAESFVGSGYIEIAALKLEPGDTATTFVPRPFHDELLKCQRYLIYQPPGYKSLPSSYCTATNISVYYPFPAKMRTAPTLSLGTRASDWLLRTPDDTTNTTGTLNTTFSTSSYGIFRLESGTFTSNASYHIVTTGLAGVKFDARF
jgi:hypothetical protein